MTTYTAYKNINQRRKQEFTMQVEESIFGDDQANYICEIQKKFEDAKNQLQMSKLTILALVGPGDTGKSTVFDFLRNESSGQTKSLQNNRNLFGVVQKSNMLIIDFPTPEKIEDDLIWEEFFLFLIKHHKVQLLYVLKQESEKIQRGNEFYNFIAKYFSAQNQPTGKQNKLSVILNQYNGQLNEDQLIASIKKNLTKFDDFIDMKFWVFNYFEDSTEKSRIFAPRKRDDIIFYMRSASLPTNNFSFVMNKTIHQSIVSLFKQVIQEIATYFNNQGDKFSLQQLQEMQEQIKIQKENQHKLSLWLTSIQCILERTQCSDQLILEQNRLYLLFRCFPNLMEASYSQEKQIVQECFQLIAKNIYSKISRLTSKPKIGDFGSSTQVAPRQPAERSTGQYKNPVTHNQKNESKELESHKQLKFQLPLNSDNFDVELGAMVFILSKNDSNLEDLEKLKDSFEKIKQMCVHQESDFFKSCMNKYLAEIQEKAKDQQQWQCCLI